MAKALRQAAFNGDFEQFQMLLSTATNAQKSSLLKSAIYRGYSQVVADLIHDGVPVSSPALLDAVRGNHEDVVRILTEAGCDVDVCADNGMNALMYAAKFGSENIVLSLLRANADVNLFDMKGLSALCYALLGDHENIAELLIGAGAQGDGLEAVLGQAVLEGNLDKTRLLLKAGADPNNSMQAVPIVIAAKQGNHEIVLALIQAGADVNKTNSQSSRTALHYAFSRERRDMAIALMEAGAISAPFAQMAIKDGDLEMLEHLLRNGVHPNDPSNGMLIVTAAKHGNEAMVEALIKAGADVNLRYPGNRTALMHAAQLGMKNSVQSLLEAGADVNTTLEKGHTALMWACSEGHEQVVQLLLDAGANTELRNRANMTALANSSKTKFGNHIRLQAMIAKAAEENTFRNADESYFPIAKDFSFDNTTWSEIDTELRESKITKSSAFNLIFSETAQIDQTDMFNRTILMYAAYLGYGQIVNLLLEHGALIDVTDINGLSALTWAANGGNSIVVGQLLDAKASINLSDNRMRTPLHHAVRGRDYAVASVLIANGGILRSFKQIEGALVWAARFGNKLLLAELVRVGADVTEIDDTGGTALMWAASTGNAGSVQALLDAGASTEVQDSHCKKAMWYAIDGGHIEALNMLMQWGASVEDIDRGHPALCIAARAGKIDLLRTLLKYNINQKCTSEDGTTALMFACRSGHIDVARTLVDSGTNVGTASDNGNTALFEATYADSQALIELLLNCGADIEARNKTGQTPLLVAAEFGHPIAVRALLDGGANMYATDNEEQNFSDIAEKSEDKGERATQALVEFYEENQKKSKINESKDKERKHKRKRELFDDEEDE